MPDADTSPAVLVETQGDALWIRLNRPRRRNAYDAEMADLIVDALQAANTFRSVVVTGVQRSFCAGGSLSTLGAPTPGALRGLYAASLRMFDAIRSCPRPVTTRKSIWPIGSSPTVHSKAPSRMRQRRDRSRIMAWP